MCMRWYFHWQHAILAHASYAFSALLALTYCRTRGGGSSTCVLRCCMIDALSCLPFACNYVAHLPREEHVEHHLCPVYVTAAD
ncbi:hypothetical protein BD413DRAFT_573703 [Trametes elegans]|nr:hypothetical protein BD413DRAFT_573703 [Trametes elegans]